MDFIERIFGFSPDNGSGTFESGLVIAAIVFVAAIYFVRRRGSLKK
ncbi:hypothetical protein [Mesorhizobium salmacidum]|uniref:LPXTG cell wall anchor domain-containing protein n=1 Tax=Mesorhizobium salmacidum TaxID=3015171 RepID=A0ABU8KSJ6_9HYPH